ncbi:MAG: flagellar hook-length control protein FliK [Nitrospirota bacterium]
MLESNSILLSVTTSPNMIIAGEGAVNISGLIEQESSLFQEVLTEAEREEKMQTVLEETQMQRENEHMGSCMVSSDELCATLSLLSVIGMIAPSDSFEAPMHALMADLPEQAVLNSEQDIPAIVNMDYTGYALQQPMQQPVAQDGQQPGTFDGNEEAYPATVAIADVELDELIASLLLRQNNSKMKETTLADLNWAHFNQEMMNQNSGEDLAGFTFEGRSLTGYKMEAMESNVMESNVLVESSEWVELVKSELATSSKSVPVDQAVLQKAAKEVGREFLTDDQGVKLSETVMMREGMSSRQTDTNMTGLQEPAPMAKLTEPAPMAKLTEPAPMIQTISLVEGQKSDRVATRFLSPQWRPESQIVEHELMEQIVQKVAINKMVSKGSDRIRLELEPKELGALTIDIAIHKNVVSADILTQSAAVKEILDKNQTILRDALANAGFVVDQFSVNVGDFGQSSRHFPYRDQSNGYGTRIALQDGESLNHDLTSELGILETRMFSGDGQKGQISVYV